MKNKSKRLVTLIAATVMALSCGVCTTLGFTACTGGPNSSIDTPDKNPDKDEGENPDETPDEDPDEKPDEDPDEKPDEDPDEKPDEDPDDPVITPDDGLFADGSGNYTLEADYVLSADDIEDTGGTSAVELGACTFDLGGYTLDLGGLTLNISSQGEEKVTFTNGAITNGTLNISVPEGDIEFNGAKITNSVTYTLEAASDTILFSNASIAGNCTIISDSRVQVNYSAVANITLAGNGNLVAGDGAELGSVKVDDKASGATITVTPSATLSDLELKAAAIVNVAGSVNSVKVDSAAKEDKETLSINVTEGANVSNIELNAAAEVTVSGTVSNVTVSESAKEDEGALKIDVKESAKVTNIALSASAEVTVSGTVSNVTVSEEAKDDPAEMQVTVTESASVTQIELGSKASVSVSGGVDKVVVKKTAEQSSVTLEETATVDTVAVSAQQTTVSSDNANLSQVLVDESVSDSTVTGVSDSKVISATKEEIEEATKHTAHEYAVTAYKAPTCTEEGYTEYKCIWCDQTKTEKSAALGHSEWYSVRREPTATEDGIGVYTCTRCGQTREVSIEKTASFVLEGLDRLYELIPDGTYYFKTEDGKDITISQNDYKMTLSGTSLVAEVADGTLRAVLRGKLILVDEDETGTIDIKAIFTGNRVALYGLNCTQIPGVGSSTTNDMFFSSLSGALREMLYYFAGVDPDDIHIDYDALGELLSDEAVVSAIKELAAAFADKIAPGVTDDEGNTV